jgi:hypothetical protein
MWRIDEPQTQQRGVVIRLRGTPVDVPHVLCSEPSIIPAYQGQRGIESKSVQACLEVLRQQSVIGIQKNQECSGAHSNARVSRRRQALIGLADVTDRGEPAGHLARVVRGPIIHDHNLVRRMRLLEHALDGVTQKLRLPVTRNDDAHQFRLAAGGIVMHWQSSLVRAHDHII